MVSLGKTYRSFKKYNQQSQRRVLGASYKTYCNSLIRQGKFNPTFDGYIKHFDGYWKDKVVGGVKTEKHKLIKTEIGQDLLRELKSLKKFITNLTSFMGHLVSAKQIIIVALNRVKSIGTFKKTDKGFEAVNPEGYVAIDRSGKRCKACRQNGICI